ncbi:MAG: hypothetical protein ABFE07_28425 [Armatimonadia bacterium]
MYKILSDKKVPFTKKLAEEMTAMPKTIWERTLSDGWVNHLATEITNGMFVWEQVTLAVAHFKGVKYAINGKHTCYARFFHLPDDPSPMVRMVEYGVDGEEDMRSLYSRYDRGKNRASGPVIDSLLFGTTKFKDADKPTLRALVPGYRLWKSPVREGRHETTVDQACAALLEPEVGRLAACVLDIVGKALSTRTIFRRQAVVAAMFATAERSMKGCAEFWAGVQTGAELKMDDPRLKLRNYLMQHNVNLGGGARRQKPVAPEDMFRACIYSWNAWRRGESMQIIKVPVGCPRPVVGR